MASKAEIRRSDAVPGNLLLVGGLLLGGAGVLTIAVAAQFMAWWSLPVWATVAAWLQIGLGAAALLLGRYVADGRPVAAILGSLLAPALVLASLAWAGFALWSLSFTLLMFLAPPAGALASLVLPFTIRPALRCAAARRVLRAELAAGRMFGFSAA